ncbi:MAG: hypothetical protein K2M27_02500 [Muribaculaceae bacterium]|nr:hypothetical protein [Muribaculaceae bacterium]
MWTSRHLFRRLGFHFFVTDFVTTPEGLTLPFVTTPENIESPFVTTPENIESPFVTTRKDLPFHS